MKKQLITTILAFLFIVGTALAQAPKKFNYQGIARNASGLPLSSQAISLKISVLNGSTAGAVEYSEKHAVTTNAYGLYNVEIGGGSVLAGTMNGVSWGSSNKYLKVEMDPAGGNIFTVLGNSELLSVPYSLYAASGNPGPAGAIGPVGPKGATGAVGPIGATGAVGPQGPAGATGATGSVGPIGPVGATGAIGPVGATGAIGPIGPQGPAGAGSLNGTTNKIIKFTGATTGGNSQITDDGTSVGVNVTTLNSTIKLEVNNTTGTNTLKSTLIATPGTIVATPSSIYGQSSTGIGVLGISNSQSGVYGLSSGSLGGVTGVNSSTGNGIWGLATGAGVSGYFDGGTSGRGVVVTNGASGFGTETPTSRLSVIQPTTSVPRIDTFPAISAFSSTTISSLKGAVYGTYNTSYHGVGVQGLGWLGVNNQNSNATFGQGSQDIGVYGSANTAGVIGTSLNGIGVLGINKAAGYAATTGLGNSYGLYGNAASIGGSTAPSTRYGIYGGATGATTNYAGYFAGNVSITGTVSKGSGTFKIDNPLDPENKYLYHSFVESPEMMNIYNGITTTDANGYAVVTMPSYFEALNKEFRYQLTVMGVFAQAIISKEINNEQFTIQTNQPNVKVSWQVTGVRHDKFAEAHPIVVEAEKEPEFKGYYLHAKEWGQPESKSIDFLTRPKTKTDNVESKSATEINIVPEQKNKNKNEIGGVIIKTNQ